LTTVTIDDVAELADVSIKTVSRVLNNEPNVRAATREKVLAAVKQLEYRPSQSARSLAGSRSFLLCHFYDNPSPAYLLDVELGASSICREAGYHLIVERLDGSDPTLAASIGATVTALRLDGVILTPPISDNTAVLDILERNDTPYVRFAPYMVRNRGASVAMDDRRAAYEMTGLLIGLGHRRIGFIKGHPDHGASDVRLQGHLEALRDQGISVREDWIKQGYFSFDSGVAAAESLLTAAERPSAIFATNDDMAMGVVTVGHRLGLDLPDQLSIVGFDDTPGASYVWPRLTTVRQPVTQMAAAATQMLISGEATRSKWPAGKAPARLLDFEIVVRDSARSPDAASAGRRRD
jgi:LacI family transcriptional regulator, galactose operon repressor